MKESKNTEELQGFQLIKGKGPINANVATLRMLARAYNTPCPIDVIEKVIESSVERMGAVPINGMGQLAESLGLQSQIGEVDIEKLKRLEFPVLLNNGKYFFADIRYN